MNRGSLLPLASKIKNLSSPSGVQKKRKGDEKNPTSLKKKYSYWRFRIMYSMMIGYAAYYLVRSNFAMVIPSLQSEFGYTKTEIGWIITIFSIVYGIGKCVNGLLSDRINARYFMAFGLGVSALLNLTMGWVSGLWAFALVWGLNAWFQSMGWPPCSRLLTRWYSPKELGTKWGIWNASHPIGGALTFALSGFLIEHYDWRYAFFVPGVLCLFIFPFLMERLRDGPKTVNLPSIEEYSQLTRPHHKEDDNLSFTEILFHRVLKNKLIWYVSMGNFFLYMVRMGIFNWAPTFLKEAKNSTLNMAGWQAAGYEVAGIFGGIAAGLVSDRLFHGRRGPVSTFCMMALSLFMIYFWVMPAGHHFWNTVVMMLVGFFVYGPQVLVGVAAADFASKKAVGAATGFTGTMGYFGTAVSGIGVGALVDRWGWGAGFLFFVAAAFMGIFFFSLTWNHRSKLLEGKVSD
jgi:phosphoglycerate transporter family protein